MPRKATSRTPAAGRRRAVRLYLAMGVCEQCGLVPAAERHHRDRDPLNNAPENVVRLCVRCHKRAHLKTHCRHGHPLSGDNLYVDPRGRRVCRACHREQEKRRRG